MAYLRFGELLVKTWKDYTKIWKKLMIFGVYFYLIPMVIITFIFSLSEKNILITIPGMVLIFIISATYSATVIRHIGKKSKLNFPENLGNGIRYLVFMIVLGLLLIIPFLFLVIPGIVISFYLLFSIIIFTLDEGFPFKKSIRTSWKLIEGKWWRTLGVYGLFATIIGTATMIITYTVSLTLLPITLLGEFGQVISQAVQQFVNVIIMPIGIIFIINLYRNYRKEIKTRIKTSQMAVWGYICSYIIPVIGLILSIIALVKLNKSKKEYGKALAISGIINSLFFMLLWVIVLIAVFVVGVTKIAQTLRAL